MSTYQIWLLVKLDDIQTFFIVTSIILIIAAIILDLMYWIGAERTLMRTEQEHQNAIKDTRDTLGKIPLITTITAVILSILAVLTPTTKEAAAIILIPRIVNNKEVQKLPSQITNLASEWIEQLRPNKEKK